MAQIYGDNMPIVMVKPLVELTEDGSQTLLHPIIEARYHSLKGAVGESIHVFIRGALERFNADKVRVFEMGFGSGLNAFLTMRSATERGIEVEYTAIEMYPVAPSLAMRLDYAEQECFVRLHTSQWGVWNDICDCFKLRKIEVDLVKYEFCDIFDIIYFDAFAPDVQPELWTQEIFDRIYAHLVPGGILVTSTSKVEVKKRLISAGFKVSRVPGALGKRHHMMMAMKPL